MTRRPIGPVPLVTVLVTTAVALFVVAGPSLSHQFSPGTAILVPDRPDSVAALTVDDPALAVLPVRTTVEHRDQGAVADPWRTLALAVAAGALVAAALGIGTALQGVGPRISDPTRRWARFRAPPAAAVLARTS